MQPYIHKKGAQNAQSLAEKAQLLGIKDKFNDDPKISVETFPQYKKYPFLQPETNKDDANLYANLIRMCVHFEIETLTFMQVMGFDAATVYPQTVDKFMGQNTLDSLKDRFTEISPSELRSLGRDIAIGVYQYLQKELELSNMNWNSL